MTKAHQRIMALDVGDARIGVALSDPLALCAQPHCTVNNIRKSAIKEILEIARSYNVAKIIIGMPLELSGEMGEQARKVEKFSNRLKGHLSHGSGLAHIEVLPWDERFSTLQAEHAVAGSKLRNKERRSALDRISAALLLESFLSSSSLPPSQ